VNTDAPWPTIEEAWTRVLEIQTKLHQWAANDPDRRFVDLHNLVCDPAFLLMAWKRVRGNRGAPLVWTAKRPTTSGPNGARNSSSLIFGPLSRPERSGRSQYENG